MGTVPGLCILVTPMLTAAFTIRFVMPVEDDTFVGKVRNFGEDLMRTMRDQRLGEVSDPDHGENGLSVRLRSRRHLGQARKLISGMLTKHYLDANAVVSEI